MKNQDNDDKQRREPTRCFDYHPLWLERLIEAEFPFLRRPKKQWRPPNPSNIKYSKISKKRISERRGNQGNVKTDGRHAKQLRTRKNPRKKAQG